MKKPNEPVYVTQPFLPPLEEFQEYLKQIWDSKWLTNNGKFHQELEKELCKYLDVKYISLFANGTLALVTALKVLKISGEVITTPFSFVATTHAIWWNGIMPVFVDIEPNTFNLNPEKIEEAITPKTQAILPVHVYGNPCDIKRIQKIEDNLKLKIIFDAAHSFGVQRKGKSILNHGDLSILSFHATKVFSTFEGGAIVCHNEEMKKSIDYLKNFGFADEVTVVSLGINAKMNEFQASLGLLQLKYIDKSIRKRKKIAGEYRLKLEGINGLTYLEDFPEVKHCYSYFPILISKEKFGKNRDELYDELKKYNIFNRRYFYPLISQFPMYKEFDSAQPEKLPVAMQVAQEVICLPIYADMGMNDLNRVVSAIKKARDRGF
jgi:dTDP-4-amino-4,6-dideoxygalactose transaminase